MNNTNTNNDAARDAGQIEKEYCDAVRRAAKAYSKSQADPRDDDANRAYKTASRDVDRLCAEITDEQMERLDAELGLEVGRDY